MYLAHSGHASLSLRVHISSSHGACIAALLSQHLHRAKVLVISYVGGVDDSPFEQLLFDLQGKFNLLTHFQLDCDIYKFRSSPYVNAFARAPQLTHVCIPSVSGIINLPWSQITHYHGECRDLKGIYRKLPHCQRLERLEISSRHFGWDNVGSVVKPIILPHLREVYIWDMDGVAHELFDSLHASLLEVVDIATFEAPPVLGALLRCLERSSCISLTSLKLLGYEINVEELLRLSALAPSLQQLDFDDQMITAGVAQALEVTPEGDNIFPHLTMLTIRQFRRDLGAFLRVYLSRCYPGDLGHVVRPVKQLACCCIYFIKEGAARSLHNLLEAFEEDSVFQEIIERSSKDRCHAPKNRQSSGRRRI
ncbi:hypothetical protein BD779DRAFT_249436 [Infundibulicybe gibba]|nr:hypothetical protein BD779DRAFT_249436 [Infundibulicybe gibba]